MDRKLIKRMEGLAKHAALGVLKSIPNRNGHNDFNDVHPFTKPKWNISRDGKELKFNFNQWAVVSFKDIRPRKIYEGAVEEPQRINERITDVNSVKITNDSDEPVERTYTVGTSFESSRTKSMTNSLEISISTTFSTGGELSQVKNETSLSTTYGLEISEESSSTSASSKEDEMSITVPPRKVVTVTSRATKAKYKQKAKFDAEIDFSIYIDSHADWAFRFDSLEALYDFIQGVDGNPHWVGQHFKENPSNWQLPTWMLRMPLEIDFEFDNATTGDVIVQQEDL